MSAADRERILRYPDLAARLCEPPLNYKTPSQWTGFIPPEVCEQRLNLSPERGALVELAQEAYRRDAENTPIPTTATTTTEA